MITGDVKVTIGGVEMATASDFRIEAARHEKEISQRLLGSPLSTGFAGSFTAALAHAGTVASRAAEDWRRFSQMFGMPPLRHIRFDTDWRRWIWDRRIERDGSHRRHRRALRRLNKAARRAARKA